MAKKKDPCARIFVVGFMGSDRYGLAQKIAEEKGFVHVDTDDMIQHKENQTIAQLCRSQGEHAYRNREYEALSLLSGEKDIVVSCGDGIVLDEMCRSILKRHPIVLADDTPEVLFEHAKEDKNLPYAFLMETDEKRKFKKFCELYEIRKPLYHQCIEKEGDE